ncbi:Hsp70 protein-domain-containing protein [Aspergillus granulosus]|uniref:Hsp70 protein-domain-containing protein n=1 Tax=Aspergillus granulosus TaxID=176169 RepID=A0ABR4H950_9EURO
MRSPRHHGSNRIPKRLPSLLVILFLTILFALGAAACPGNTPETPSEKLIGIHLGRTESSASGIKNGTITIFTRHGNDVTQLPSIVAWADGGLVAGEGARQFLKDSPDLFRPVLEISEKFNASQDESSDGEQATPKPPIAYVHQNNRQAIELTTNATRRTFFPEEIYAPLLTELLRIAESQIGPNITGAIVSLPRGATDADREYIAAAGKLAGLPIIRQMNETTSTLLALGLDEISYEKDRYALMFDMGEEFDLSIVEIDMGAADMIASHKTRLMGGDLDSEAYSQMLMEMLLSDPEDILEIVENIVPYMNQDLITGSLKAVDEVLMNANLSRSDITDLIFSGDFSLYPDVQDEIERYLSNDSEQKLNVANTIMLAEAPVWGAALVASRMMAEEWLPCCCSTYRPPIGIGISGGEVVEVIPSCSELPVRLTESFMASCNEYGMTLVQLYMRDIPYVSYHAMIELGDAYLANTTITDILLAEFDFPTPCRKGEKPPTIEIQMFISRQMELVVKASDRKSGEEVMLTFPDPDFECGRERDVPRNYTTSSGLGRDLEWQYQRNLRMFVGGRRWQKPMLARRDEFTFDL